MSQGYPPPPPQYGQPPGTYGQQYPGMYPGAGAQKTSGVAVTGFICSLAGLLLIIPLIPGIICSAIGISKTGPMKSRGRGNIDCGTGNRHLRHTLGLFSYGYDSSNRLHDYDERSQGGLYARYNQRLRSTDSGGRLRTRLQRHPSELQELCNPGPVHRNLQGGL